jgi:hypothetical protein
MSAKCHEWKSLPSFDHLVGAAEQRDGMPMTSIPAACAFGHGNRWSPTDHGDRGVAGDVGRRLLSAWRPAAAGHRSSSSSSIALETSFKFFLIYEIKPTLRREIRQRWPRFSALEDAGVEFIEGNGGGV